MNEVLRANLLSPFPLSFALGAFARSIRSDLRIPKEAYQILSVYLLLALGLKGGVELGHARLGDIVAPAGATLLLGILTPLFAWAVLRLSRRFPPADCAAIAAHYGSVSAVTFFAAQQFVGLMGAPAEPFMTTLLTLLESPGIHVALAIGVLTRRPADAALGSGGPEKGRTGQANWKSALHEILAGRTLMLLVGGLLVGLVIGQAGYEPIRPFFEGGFKGALVIFLLEMGMVAADRAGDLRSVGLFLGIFAIAVPLVHGGLGVLLGHAAGLSVGGCTILGAMAASASYIAAPPATRATLPEANPSLSLTASLGITFPFNLVVGIPAYFQFAQWVAR